MKTLWIILILSFLTGCASRLDTVDKPSLVVTEVNPNKWTAITKQNLLHLTSVYDLGPFFFTRRVIIQSRVIPHSHPVLTLNTRYAEKPNRMMASFLHEQFHWWLNLHKPRALEALKILKKTFPNLPEVKGMSERSRYLHLAVNYLEWKGLEHFLGAKLARNIIVTRMTRERIYSEIYSTVLKEEQTIRKILELHELLPPPLR